MISVATGRPVLQILATTFLINLRFLIMSAAIAPYFRRAKRLTLLFSSHFISISTFIVPYIHFQKEPPVPLPPERARSGDPSLRYFLGVALPSFSVWVLGSGLGYWAALRVPPGFEEGLRFMLPGYFACMLTLELRGRTALVIGALSFIAAVPGALLNPDWGWLLSALLIGTGGWGIDQWMRGGSR